MMSDVHLKCMCGGMEKVKIQDDLKKVNVQCLVEDPQLRTTGIKVTSTNKIIDDLHKQLTSLLNEDLTSSSLIIKSKWCQTFKISDDAFSSYEYGDLPVNISTECRIVKIETIEQKYYDWKHYFQFSITKGNDSNISNIHVVLNECNVFGSFFDLNVYVGIFGEGFTCRSTV